MMSFGERVRRKVERKQPQDSTVKLIPLGLFLLIFGGFLIAGYVRAMRHTQWMATDATVSVAEMRRKHSMGRRESTTCVLRYVYFAEGRQYVSNLHTINHTSSCSVVRRLKPGDRVTAYYSLRDPSLAVIELREASDLLVSHLLGGAGFAVAGAGMMAYGLRKVF